MQHQRRTFRRLQREGQRTWTRVGPSRLVSAAAPRQASPLPCLARALATTSSMLSALLLLLLLLQLLCACGICCCSVGERCARSLAADTPTLPLSSSPARFGRAARIRCAGWKWMCLAWWWEWPASAPSSHALSIPCDSGLSCLTYYRLSALPKSVSFLFSPTVRPLTAATDMLLPAATPNNVASSATSSTSATATLHMLPSSTPASPPRCW